MPTHESSVSGGPRANLVMIGGNNDAVTAAPAIAKSQIHSLTRPNMVSVGTIVWLSSELMFFAALFAMYFSIRAAAPELWEKHTEDPTMYSAAQAWLADAAKGPVEIQGR